MTPTKQQTEIITTKLEPGESLLVEAGAGTGKTTCFIEFSKENPSKKILYICFNNKSAREAKQKYEEAEIQNTTTSTIHGLARSKKALYEKAQKFQTKISLKEIQKHLQCNQILAWQVQATLKTFCESRDSTPNLSHLPIESLENPLERRKILQLTETLWDDMKNPKHPFPISYDHYLKAYEIENPILNYDYILLDECQDSNPISLSLIEKQKNNARIILIGDRHQAIYSWRGAKNAMDQWQPTLKKTLSESFRFGPNIANLANLILEVYQNSKLKLVGHKKNDKIGQVPKNEPHTLIARTNATLFETALQNYNEGKKIHFVGTSEKNNWDPSIPYKFEDALDVYRLWAGERNQIKNPQIRIYDTYTELKRIADGDLSKQHFTGDTELQSLCRLVEKYRYKLPNLLQQITQNSTSPQKAHLQLVTAHRSKGLEWPHVKLADDFTPLIMEKNGKQTLATPQTNEGSTQEEEFNLLYVAITRALKTLEPNQEILKVLHSPLLPQHLTKPILEKKKEDTLLTPTSKKRQPIEWADQFFSSSP